MNRVDGWQYYKRAVIPTCAPHEIPNTKPVFDKTIWNIDGRKPLFARWTTDFDTDYNTGWYYVIKEGPFDIQTLDSKCRKHIRQALKKVYVRKVAPRLYAEQLYNVHKETCKTYDNYKIHTTLEDFYNCTDDRIDYWAAFAVDDDRLVGYIECIRMKEYAETLVAKYSPPDLNLRASDALHYSVLDYYLNKKKFRYVCSGSKNISHRTNAQEYKIKNFGFRKAYCKLHIQYRPMIKVIVNILFLFRKLLCKFDKIGFIHNINGILTMEEIVRKQRKNQYDYR